MSNSDDTAAATVRGWIGNYRATRADHIEFARTYQCIAIATTDPASRDRWRKAVVNAVELARAANRRVIDCKRMLKAGNWTAGSVSTINK